MAEGADVSEHQGELPPSFFDAFDFVIIRAFNENGYPDRTFNDNWRKAAGRTMRGVYGWPTPFIAGDDFRLGQITVDIAPDAEAGYWADREWVNGGAASVGDVENYLRGIESRGKLAGLYSNIGELPRSPYLDAHLWWMADYGPNNGVRHDPYDQAPVPPRDRPYTIHQYSSRPFDKNWSADLAWTGFVPAPTLKESDVLYRATTAATFIPDIGAGSVWANAGTRFLRVHDVPQGAVVLDVPGDDIAAVSYEQSQINKAAETTLQGGGSAPPASVPTSFDFSGTATAHQ